MRGFSYVCVVIAGLCLGACENSSPADAASTTPTTLAPAISPATTVLGIGQAAVYSLVNVTTTGTTTWTSSDPSILTIDSGGNVAALAKGTVTITATTSDTLPQSAALQVQVVPSYQGTWTGTTANIACTDITGFTAIKYCSQSLGTAEPLSLVLTQNGLSVAGTMSKTDGGGVLNGTVAGSIGAGGDVILSGTLSGVSRGANLTASLISWDSLVTGTNMTGVWAANITSAQVLGLATVQWSLTGVTRTAP